MKLIGNILWFIFGGLFLGLLWLLIGALLCITIIGIPFGLQCFKVAKLSFAPFGKKVDLNPSKHIISNVIWAILCGWELALIYLVSGIICCITIFGIPNGILSFKLMKLAFCPFGAKVK
ncbi:MAG: YccF domain-containing protein [Ruminococcaceae bacterium]|nr:YccF domain-containing protein [Oscillospiraceae bacterium]